MGITNENAVKVYTPATPTSTFAISIDVETDSNGDAVDVKVEHRDSTGTLTELTGGGSDYTISGTNINTTSSYTSGDIIIISREWDKLQSVDLDNAEYTDYNTFEDFFDRFSRICQESINLGERSIRLANDDDSGDAITLPLTANRQQKIIGFDSNGDIMMYIPQAAILDASDVPIVDAGGYFSGTDVEAALQELGLFDSNLALTTNGNGASMIGVEDAGGYYTGTDIEAVLQELGVVLSWTAADLSITDTYTNYTTDDVDSALDQIAGEAMTIDGAKTFNDTVTILNNLSFGTAGVDRIITFDTGVTLTYDQSDNQLESTVDIEATGFNVP